MGNSYVFHAQVVASVMNVESKYCDDCNISVKAITLHRVI